ncbi:Ribosomal RNA small subunit methyltransferase E [Nitrospira sp. KM1]|uniref:16S rRNA (uracil(1498)-N(3))-methyltransferase n=1 Tax=Nitrospira sp. KM1 TaxID=1936990 RepID=UPI0013A7729E|nr:16S rRNA (uracil(1498)-N(3))-methyltransferase [Nitrospira sp. KM1]BCA53167.1 Ribosomal RNA small subunit methyltransferase E [Nitrospira sp. KM1]
MPTFFVTSTAVAHPLVRISGPLLHHVRDVLRLKVGDDLLITDDRRGRYRTRVTGIGAQGLESRIVETIATPVRTSPSLVLVQALLKGDKMEWVIQKATELGVDSIIPIRAKHAVVKIQPDRIEHQLERWRRIALEAAQQSERWTVPTIAAPTDLSKAEAALPSAQKLMLVERSSESSLTSVPLPSGSDQTVMLLIGPEGGWDDEEPKLMQERGYRLITLGSRVLRAETAAIAALSIVQSRLGELG